MTTISKKRTLDDYEPLIPSSEAPFGIIKRARVDSTQQQGNERRWSFTDLRREEYLMKKGSGKDNVGGQETLHELSPTTHPKGTPKLDITHQVITDDRILVIDDAMEITNEEEDSGLSTNWKREAWAGSRLSKEIRAQALASTHHRVNEIFQIIGQPISEDAQIEGFYMLLETLHSFGLAAKENAFCWHLTAAEQEDFRKIAVHITAMCKSMLPHSKIVFAVRCLQGLNHIFESMLGMKGFFTAALRCLRNHKRCTPSCNMDSS